MRISEFLLLNFLFLAPAFADGLADSRAVVKATTTFCAELSAKAEGLKEQKGSCEKGVAQAANQIAIACKQLEKNFNAAVSKAEKAVGSGNRWIRRKSVVTEDEDSITIHFDLTNDPSYPLRNSDDIVNKDVIEKYFVASQPAKETLKKIKNSCGKNHRGLLDRYRDLYGDRERRAQGLGDLYEELAHKLGDYLMEAMNAHRAGNLHEAQEEFKKRTAGSNQ